MSLDDWLEANEVETLPDDDKIFKFESSEQEEVRAAKPWERDPNFFKSANSIQEKCLFNKIRCIAIFAVNSLELLIYSIVILVLDPKF